MLWNFSLLTHTWIRLNTHNQIKIYIMKCQNENFLFSNTYAVGIPAEITAHIMSHQFLPNNHHPPANISL